MLNMRFNPSATATGNEVQLQVYRLSGQGEGSGHTSSTGLQLNKNMFPPTTAIVDYTKGLGKL